MKIYIVIPALNESKRIVDVINDLKNYNYHNIIVVDDGSDDNTSREAKNAGAMVVKHFINRGMGAALQTGNELAVKLGADIVVHFDADGQMQAKDIVKMIKPIEMNKVDVTLGSRFLDNTSKIPFSKKNILLPVSRIINFLFTGVWLSDAHNGFRAMNKESIKKINITQDRMAHNTEIVAKIKKYNISYKEIPVTIVYHEYGQGFSGGIKIIKDLIIQKLFR